MGLRVGRSGLFAGLLGVAFEDLDSPVQKVHGGEAPRRSGPAGSRMRRRCPRAWRPGAVCYPRDGGQYHFAIEARLAGVGLLIRYEGTLRG